MSTRIDGVRSVDSAHAILVGENGLVLEAATPPWLLLLLGQDGAYRLLVAALVLAVLTALITVGVASASAITGSRA